MNKHSIYCPYTFYLFIFIIVSISYIASFNSLGKLELSETVSKLKTLCHAFIQIKNRKNALFPSKCVCSLGFQNICL